MGAVAKEIMAKGKEVDNDDEYDYESCMWDICKYYEFEGKFYELTCAFGSPDKGYSIKYLMTQQFSVREVEKHEEEITYTRTIWR
jgi:hypothetical protein